MVGKPRNGGADGHTQSTSKRPADTSATDKRTEDNGTHNAKRSRVSRACDQCRASREKCDGLTPTCSSCTAQNRVCSYNEQPKKRGIQPNYIRTLELALSWLLQTFPQAELLLTTSLPQEGNLANVLIGAKNAAASESLHLAWRNCLVNKQIDQLLSGIPIDKDGPLVADRAVDRSQVTSDHALLDSPPPTVPEEHRSTYDVPTGEHTAFEFSALASSNVNLAQRSTLVMLPKDAWTLLEYYFAFTHSWLPMTEKHNIMKLMYSYPPEGAEFDDLTLAEHAELWSILALAAAQTFDEAKRSEAVRIRDVAERLIPDGNVSYQVPHIKAMIILALLDVHNERILAAWLRIGKVVSLLLLFKLLENLGATEKWCRHIHLAAFVLESALAAHLKAPTHFRVDYIEAIRLIDEDGMDEWAPWHDPLVTSQPTGVAKAPARSFSTLNNLVRMAMRSSDEASVNLTGRSTNNSIVFSLLQNAARQHDRMQPFALVVTHAKVINTDAQASDALPDPASIVAGPFESNSGLGDISIATFAPDDTYGFQDTQQQHLGLNVHVEPNNSPGLVKNGQPKPTNWSQVRPDSIDQIEASDVEPSGQDMSGADIFQEFDAMLERHDSNHRPQFMQNLGFAPDLDLMEFFGDDYQPSDPLLAYLQPASSISNRNVVRGNT